MRSAEGPRDVADALARLLRGGPSEAPPLLPLAPGEPPARVVAVDGSSATLVASGGHAVVAHRAGAVLLDAGRSVPLGPAELRLELLDAATCGRLVEERLARAGAPGLEAGPLGLPAALDALRSIGELVLARELLQRLEEGDVLLLDGALQVRPPVTLLDGLLAEAGARGVDVVAVAKSTSLRLGDVPALAACQLAARRKGLDAWACELPAPVDVRGRVMLARLSRAEERPFRFDVATRGDPVDVLARLATLGGHPGYPGYPSPLAMAHHAVVLAEDERRDLAARLRDEVLARGVPEDAWRAAFFDYHEVLDLGV